MCYRFPQHTPIVDLAEALEMVERIKNSIDTRVIKDGDVLEDCENGDRKEELSEDM